MSRNDNLDQFDDLIAELKQEAERPSIPPTFKKELRSQLLDQYEQSRFSWGNMRQWVGTAVALSVLAFIVIFSWSSLSRQSGAASATMGTVDVPGRDEFIVYDQLRLEFPMWVELDSGWAEMTAESWQSLDGTFFRGEVVDANDKQRIFVQGDGQFLWRGTYDSSIDRMDTVSLQYFDVYHALAQAEGWAGNFTTPPFYDDLGWDGLVQTVLRLDWHCEGLECINEYMIEPPLDVNSRDGEYEPYGWGVDLVGTETAANGRSLTTYRIDYTPNQDGNTSSQYRLVKLDSNSNTVVEVADYDGETLLRRLEHVSHQLMTSADLPADQFTQLPAGMSVSYWLPQGKVTTETPLLEEPNGEPLTTLATGTRLELSGLMNNKLAVVRDGITWQYVTVPNVGQGWVDEAALQWPITQYGNLINMDTSQLPTAVPVQTQLTILRTYKAELQTTLPQTTGDDSDRLQQALEEIEAEIARLEQQTDAMNTAMPESANGPALITHHLSAAEVNPGEVLAVTLFWEGEPEANTMIAVHLTDSSGNLLSQQDQPYSETMELNLAVPDTAADNSYNLVIIPYDSTTGARLNSLSLKEIKVETAVSTPAQHATNDVWLISATQHARTSASDPVTLEVTVGYQFESDKEVILRPLYANPDWESVSDGILPIDGLGEPITLTEQTGTQTITFTEQPSYMRQRTNTDQPVLVMQMGYLVEHVDGPREFKFLAMSTITDFAIDLTSTDEINYQIDMPIPSEDRLWIAKATQLPRTDPDEVITLEVTIGYKLVSADEAILSLSFIHPSWETETSLDGIRYPNYNALGDEYTIQSGTGSVTFTATVEPEQITSAINSDEFRLITRLWATNENGQPTIDPIIIGFNQDMPFNVQTLEEITYQMDLSDWEVTPAVVEPGNAADTLTILDVSPPVGSELHGRTPFTVTVAYNLSSLNTAELFTSLLPTPAGAAVAGNDVQTISRGEGEVTFSFNFEPLEVGTASDWLLVITMVDPAEEFPQTALATASPHDNFPDDVYHFEP